MPNLVCLRFLSRYSQILTSEKGRKFLEKMSTVSKYLDKAPSTSLELHGAEYCSQIADKYAVFKEKLEEKEALKGLKAEAKNDKNLLSMVDKENGEIEEAIDGVCDELADLIVVENEFDGMNGCTVEFSSGVGGLEAGLFAAELMRMYQYYAHKRGWSWTTIASDPYPEMPNAIRSAEVSIRGHNAYSIMRYEAGVHRVQRNPITDPSRIHTSTAGIIVMPESAEDPDIVLKKSELKIQSGRNSGPGGQNVNHTNSAVTIKHLPTGIVVKGTEDRLQINNMKIAKEKLVNKLLQIKLDELATKSRTTRKLQATTKSWAEKIRTYNYNSGTVTDHRIQFSSPDLPSFLKGGPELDEVIEKLKGLSFVERLEDAIEQELWADRQREKEAPLKKSSLRR